jgi:hypothetical protein
MAQTIHSALTHLDVLRLKTSSRAIERPLAVPARRADEQKRLLRGARIVEEIFTYIAPEKVYLPYMVFFILNLLA